MKVLELKKLLETAPDDATVVVSSRDHSFQEVLCRMTTGLKDGREWTEDFGEEQTPETGCS
ncbi:MAG: hypothetical protein ACREAU_08905 [Nitrosopumilaceae archaeon]